MTVALSYARQSVSNPDDTEGDSLSVAIQHARNADLAIRRGDVIVARYDDVDVSGASASRRGLDSMLAHVARDDAVKTVYVYTVKRLARRARIYLDVVETLDRRGVAMVSPIDPIEDRTVATLLVTMAERELVQTSNDIAYAIRTKAARGEVTQRVPYGYRRIRDTTGLLLIPEPDEAAAIATIFAAYIAGESLTEIASALRADPSVPPRPEGGMWTHYQIARVLACATYAGRIAISASRDMHGKVRPAVDHVARHSPIVDTATWDAAQRRLATRPPAVKRKADAPWCDGLLSCAACGQRLYLITRAHDGYRSYRCRSDILAKQQRGPPCPGQQITRKAAWVEAAARAALAADLGHLLTVEEAVSRARQQHTGQGARRRATLDRQRAETGKRRAALLDALERGGLDYGRWHERDSAHVARVTAIDADLAALPTAPDPDRLAAIALRFGSVAERIPLMIDADLRAIATAAGASGHVDLATGAVHWTYADALAWLIHH